MDARILRPSGVVGHASGVCLTLFVGALLRIGALHRALTDTTAFKLARCRISFLLGHVGGDATVGQLLVLLCDVRFGRFIVSLAGDHELFIIREVNSTI